MTTFDDKRIAALRAWLASQPQMDDHRHEILDALDEIERLRKAMSVVYAERLRKALETSHRACGAPVMFWGGLGQALEHHPNCCLYEHEIWP